MRLWPEDHSNLKRIENGGAGGAERLLTPQNHNRGETVTAR
jgi:hypothetical protein